MASSSKGAAADMSTTRARLQELGLDELRTMAGNVDVDHDGLQKSKLIAAILEADKFKPSMVPEPVEDGSGTDAAVGSDNGSGDDRQQQQQRSQRQDQGQDSNRRRRRRRGRPQ